MASKTTERKPNLRILYVNTENVFHTGILRAMVLFPAQEMRDRFGHKVGFTSMFRKSEGMPDVKGHEVDTCFGRRSEKGISLENLLLHFIFAIRVLLYSRSYEILHCRSYMATAIGLLSKLVFRKLIIFDVRGYLVDEAVENGKLKTGTLAYFTMRKLEGLLFQHSDKIIAVSEAMQADILSRFSRPSMVVRNPAMVRSQNFDTKINPIVVGYNGSLKEWHLPELFFSVAKLLTEADLNLKIMVITQDTDKAKELSEVYLDSEKILIHSCPAEEVGEKLNQISIGWCVIQPTFSKSVCWPVKFNEYLAAGKPVIVNSKIGDLESLVCDNNLGVLIDPSSSHVEMANTILTYIRKTEQLYISEEISKLLSWDTQLMILDTMYREITHA